MLIPGDRFLKFIVKVRYCTFIVDREANLLLIDLTYRKYEYDENSK